MTDPIYGDSPLDPTAQWNESFRTSIVLDTLMVSWRGTWAAAMDDVNESNWHTRWRRSLLTSSGAQLEEWGSMLNFLRPDGWTDARYQAVLLALMAGQFGWPTPAVLVTLSNALITGTQTFEHTEQLPGTILIKFFDTDLDDATTYLSALNRVRPRGYQILVEYHPDILLVFTLDSSTLGGPDVLGGQLNFS